MNHKDKDYLLNIRDTIFQSPEVWMITNPWDAVLVVLQISERIQEIDDFLIEAVHLSPSQRAQLQAQICKLDRQAYKLTKSIPRFKEKVQNIHRRINK